MDAPTVKRQLDKDSALRIGSPEDFAKVRKALRQPGFEEETVQRALLNAGFTLDDDVLSTQAVNSEIRDFGPLIALFVEQRQVPRGQLEQLLDHETLASFVNLDLMRVSESDSSRYYSPVVLYPIDDLFIASDYYKPPVEGWTPPADSVYPALHSIPLLRVVPRTPVGAVLDLCSGTAIFGLALSKHAHNVVASDITERAMHFGSFNRLLNGCDNVQVVKGDLYDAVAGQTFDRIVAHAPYMPTFAENSDVQTWRDGGLSGEEIITRIIQSLPQYLRPGGEFFSAFAVAESNAVRLEQRARGWLGNLQREFDLVFAFKKQYSTKQVAKLVRERSQTPLDIDPTRVEDYLRAVGFTHYAYGVLGVRRHARSSEPWTFRTELSAKSNAASFPYAFDCISENFQPLSNAKQLRPALAGDLCVRETHQVDCGKLIRTELILEVDWPFHHAVKTDSWIRPLIDRFTGRASIEQLYTEASLAQTLPTGLSLAQFIEVVHALIRRGYLIISESVRDGHA
jgi:SAM-dependent methyltransferase